MLIVDCTGINISRFEPVERDGASSTLNINSKVLGLAVQNFIGAIVGGLQWCLNHIMSNKHMGTEGKRRANVAWT